MPKTIIKQPFLKETGRPTALFHSNKRFEASQSAVHSGRFGERLANQLSQ
jgi:hypothetical protein